MEQVCLTMFVSFLLGNMSRCQCCVCGCHNRKGRGAESVGGNQLRECPALQMEHFSKQDEHNPQQI